MEKGGMWDLQLSDEVFHSPRTVEVEASNSSVLLVLFIVLSN